MLWHNNMVTTAQVGTDPYFSSNILLMHMDGTNGGTSFPDVMGHSTTPTSCTTNTTTFKYGTASADFNGTSSRIDITYAANEFDFGTGDFTIEFWMYNTSTTGVRSIVGNVTSGNVGSWGLTYTHNGTEFTLRYGGTTLALPLGTSLSTSTWYHIAVTRSGTVLRLYVNGIQRGSNITFSANLTSANTTATIGASTDATRFFLGFLDDIRVTKGVARYSANFTAPTGPFPDN